MTDLIIALTLLTIIGVSFYRIIKYNLFKSEAIQAMWEDEHAMDEVQDEEYNGKDLYIREEEREAWDRLSRKQKRWVMNEQEKKIKSGQYHKLDNGKVITRAEAKEKGLI